MNMESCYVYALIEGGYNGSALQALLKAVPEAYTMTAITERHSNERIQLLAKANTHGKEFYATDGSHVCSDSLKQRHCAVGKIASKNYRL